MLIAALPTYLNPCLLMAVLCRFRNFGMNTVRLSVKPRPNRYIGIIVTMLRPSPVCINISADTVAIATYSVRYSAADTSMRRARERLLDIMMTIGAARRIRKPMICLELMRSLNSKKSMANITLQKNSIKKMLQDRVGWSIWDIQYFDLLMSRFFVI